MTNIIVIVYLLVCIDGPKKNSASYDRSKPGGDVVGKNRQLFANFQGKPENTGRPPVVRWRHDYKGLIIGAKFMRMAPGGGGARRVDLPPAAPVHYTVGLSGGAARLIRISFRQSMLAGFMLIALLLSWAAVRSWLVLEQFVVDSRQGSAQALQLSASIQELAERTVDLERSARQFMILKDAGLLARFDENVTHSLAAAQRLE